MNVRIKKVALLSSLVFFGSYVGMYTSYASNSFAQPKLSDVSDNLNNSKEKVSDVLSDINIIDFKFSDKNISKLFNVIVKEYFDLSIESKGDSPETLDNSSDLFKEIRDVILYKLVAGLSIKILQDTETKRCIFVIVKHPKLDLVPSAQGTFYDAVFHYEPDENSDSSLDKKYDLVIKSHPNAPVVTFYYSFDYLDEAIAHGDIREFMKTSGIELDPSEFV